MDNINSCILTNENRNYVSRLDDIISKASNPDINGVVPLEEINRKNRKIITDLTHEYVMMKHIFLNDLFMDNDTKLSFFQFITELAIIMSGLECRNIYDEGLWIEDLLLYTEQEFGCNGKISHMELVDMITSSIIHQQDTIEEFMGLINTTIESNKPNDMKYYIPVKWNYNFSNSKLKLRLTIKG